MSVQFTFRTIKECAPKHDEQIMYIRRGETYGFASFAIEYAKVEYQWEEYDEDDTPTGNSIIYNGELEVDGCKLVMIIGSRGFERDYTFDDDEMLWCSEKEFGDLLFPESDGYE